MSFFKKLLNRQSTQATPQSSDMEKNQLNEGELNTRQKLAREFYEKDGPLAIQIAMGEAPSPKNILSVFIYAEVCKQAEKSEDTELCRKLANSFHNSKLSAEARRLKLTNSNTVVEIAKRVVDMRRKAVEKTLSKGKTLEQVASEMTQRFKQYIVFLEKKITDILSSTEEMQEKINNIEIQTQQKLEKDQLAKEMCILRCTFLASWFFDVYEVKNEKEFNTAVKLILHALEQVVSRQNENRYVPWLAKEVSNHLSTNEHGFTSLKKFQSDFAENVGERIARIVFDSTYGRLAGEQYDAVVELIQTTVEGDKEAL